MKNTFFIFLFLLSSYAVFSQKDSQVLFRVDGVSVTVLDFKKVYKKNLAIIEEVNKKSISDNLNLFINFKLKLKEAYRLKIHETEIYKKEIEAYKNQLITPYLQDTIYISKLVKEAYYRTKYKINVSHVLVKISKNSSPKDTLKAYQKIMKARNEYLAGTPFDTVALAYSDDQSVKFNSGNLGYFSAFKMVYPFENAAYKTKVNDVSIPFRTDYGYHFLKVNDLKLSEGEVEVAHILLTDTSKKGRFKIDSIYKSLINGADFAQLVKQYSNDNGTISNGGKLPRFGTGRMLFPFEVASFKLKTKGAISKPFKTKFGWHIVKLIEKYPVAPFEDLKTSLKERVIANGGAQMSEVNMIKEIQKNYRIKVHKDAFAIFKLNNIRSFESDTLQKTLLTIEDKQLKQISFFNYIQNKSHKSIAVLFSDFKNQEILNYYKDQLRDVSPEFSETLREYEEGLLVFDLMQQEVWERSMKDTLGLKNYFKQYKELYDFEEVSNNKGLVMSDYQEFLEKELIALLKRKYQVKIRKKVLSKLIKQYQK